MFSIFKRKTNFLPDDVKKGMLTSNFVSFKLGENLTIDNWAQILNTINYELTCRLKVRLPRIYTR